MPEESTPRVPLGPVGAYLIDNLVRLREEQELTYRQLSERLQRLGRPIPTLGLSRIEKGARRVDVDELVALAVALEVSPAALFLPPDAGREDDDEIELSAALTVPGSAARRWAAGHAPLPDSDAISWPRARFRWRVRESEIDELRRRIDQIDQAVRAEADHRNARKSES